MRNECPQCNTIAVLSEGDVDLIDDALSAYSSDNNRAPHGDIAHLRERIKPTEQCNDCGAVIYGYHVCQGVPGGFPDDEATESHG